MRCMVCGAKMNKTSPGVYRCSNCDHAVSDAGWSSSNCDISLPQGFGKQEGWICPVCGRGVAPWVNCCPCQGSELKITYGIGTTPDDFDISEYIREYEAYKVEGLKS